MKNPGQRPPQKITNPPTIHIGTKTIRSNSLLQTGTTGSNSSLERKIGNIATNLTRGKLSAESPAKLKTIDNLLKHPTIQAANVTEKFIRNELKHNMTPDSIIRVAGYRLDYLANRNTQHSPMVLPEMNEVNKKNDLEIITHQLMKLLETLLLHMIRCNK